MLSRQRMTRMLAVGMEIGGGRDLGCVLVEVADGILQWIGWEGEEREFWLGVIETQISINNKEMDYLP